MSALNSRIARLELKGSAGVVGRFILLGGDPSPTDMLVTEFLEQQGIEKMATDMVMAGMNGAAATAGAPLSLLDVIPATRPFEVMLAELD